MPIKKCGFGLNCADMMLQHGLEPVDCPNYQTCGSASELTPDEEVELIRVREIERQVRAAEYQEARQQLERIRESIWMSRRSAAIEMLLSRGCSQTLESFGVNDSLTSIEQRIQTFRTCVEQFTTNRYIAPDNCEAHRYNVKRPYGTYWYNKLTSPEPIFEPAEEECKVKVLHLSHDDDPRNLEGRRGIERRNRLHLAETKLQVAAAALEEAIALLSEQEG
jgi:hypothetical protein